MKPIKDYVVTLDKFDIDTIEQRIAKNGAEHCIDVQLRFLDCTRPNSIRTIDYSYNREISIAVYVINNYLENKNKYYELLETRHAANLEYEAVNPPIVYKKKAVKPKTVKEKKQRTPKVDKEKVKQIKLNNLSFKLKHYGNN